KSAAVSKSKKKRQKKKRQNVAQLSAIVNDLGNGVKLHISHSSRVGGKDFLFILLRSFLNQNTTSDGHSFLPSLVVLCKHTYFRPFLSLAKSPFSFFFQNRCLQ
ncbi:hypothetical protein, partial [Geobacillus jurassicus]